MSRNVNSFFSKNPVTMDMSRSKFERNQNIKFTFNGGDLIPFYVDSDILPGDTHSIDTSCVVRMSTMIAPIMDNIYLDIYYFFVPNRLVWEHWKEFMGENTQSAWIPSVIYRMPQIDIHSSSGLGMTNGYNIGTIADYMGIPTGVMNLKFSALPFRMYALIYNEWFRDENLVQPLYFPVHDTDTYAGNNTDVYRGGIPVKVAKYHDYFTSCLPAPQKGPDVPLPLGQQALVYSGSIDNYSDLPEKNALILRGSDGSTFTSAKSIGVSNTSNMAAYSGNPGTFDKNLVLTNLIADLTTATGTSINQLREAFQVQKLYEKDALGGTRYTEIIKAHFGVSSPDARLQRPEYLGGCRIPINVHQVVQNSATDSTSPQGNTAAYSLTINTHSDFTKSFTEHGAIIGLCCVRYKHTYQQGLERQWSRKLREDYYFPVFANLGNQAVLNKEIYAQGSSVVDSDGNPYDDEVFGYQEAWAEYRYKPDRVAGQFRSNATGTLDFWHLADKYTSLPTLSQSWIDEDKNMIDRTLAVTSSVSHQFIADFYVKNNAVRPMPLYSVPGLIDHH